MSCLEWRDCGVRLIEGPRGGRLSLGAKSIAILAILCTLGSLTHLFLHSAATPVISLSGGIDISATRRLIFC